MALLSTSAQLSLHTFVTITLAEAELTNNSLLFLNFNHSYTSPKKQFINCLAFDATDGPTLWNALPDNISTAPSLTSFSKRLESHF